MGSLARVTSQPPQNKGSKRTTPTPPAVALCVYYTDILGTVLMVVFAAQLLLSILPPLCFRPYRYTRATIEVALFV